MSLRGVAVGVGYFSRFQYEAWQRMDDVEITALCNRHQEHAVPIMEEYGIERHYTDVRQMLAQERPDFIDIITPPESHLELSRAAADAGVHIICQKPLAPTLAEARQVVEETKSAGIRFMVHENFRFQPWHREIRILLDSGVIGATLHSVSFRMRMGDGWGADAYLARQPYFRDYPRLLVYETGVHFIDTFRYLAGEIDSVYSRLRKLNSEIAGEDCGVIVFNFASGAVGIWDANRYNESNHENPRYTFGDFLLEGDGGSIRLHADGRIMVQKLGEPEYEHDYTHEDRGFAGDCCFATQRHFVDGLMSSKSFETDGEDYLKTLLVQEAVYESASSGLPVNVARKEPCAGAGH